MIRLKDLKHMSNEELVNTRDGYKKLWLDLLKCYGNSPIISNDMWEARNLYTGCQNELDERRKKKD